MDVTAQVKRVNDVIDYLAMTYYNIAPLIHNMKIRPSNEIETLCVDSGGRGLFNPSLELCFFHHKRGQANQDWKTL